MKSSLVERIEQGMSDVADARLVAALIARNMAYELALREICTFADGELAMTVCRALDGHWHEPARQA